MELLEIQKKKKKNIDFYCTLVPQLEISTIFETGKSSHILDFAITTLPSVAISVAPGLVHVFVNCSSVTPVIYYKKNIKRSF